MLKEIDLRGALARIRDGLDTVYVLVPVTKETTIGELLNARGFVVADGKTPEERVAKPAPKQKPEKKNVDHGKIIALHNAGWTATAIASEVGCSIPTVTSHIKAEKEKSE
jgi:hypothetical protein